MIEGRMNKSRWFLDRKFVPDLQEKWDKRPSSRSAKLEETHPPGLVAVIAAKGASTKY